MKAKKMKMIKTAAYMNDRGPSVDDQPGFKNRDINGEGASLYNDVSIVPDGPNDIIKKWKSKKRKKTRKPIPRNSI